jgi:endonuclease/exonuclease/phosphatase family metal-dependent hydrolase
MNLSRPFRFRRFFRQLAGWMTVLAVSGLILVLISFVFIRSTEKTRAISMHTPGEPLQPPSAAPESLRMASYNLSFGRGPGSAGEEPPRPGPAELQARLQRIGGRLGELGLDLVALQQVDFTPVRGGGGDAADILARAGGFAYVVRQRNEDTGLPLLGRRVNGNVLLSRFPVSAAERIRFPPLHDWESVVTGTPDGLLARVQIGGGREIRVLVTRLDPRAEEARVRAAGMIVRIQRESAVPMVVMGDLQSTPPGFPMSLTTASGQNAIEILESFGGFQRRPARGQATWHDFTAPVSGPRRIVDWILPDRSWMFQHHSVVRDLREAEHFPVMATLRLR